MQTEELYKIFIQHPVISTDSRTLPPGCIFFALKGNNFNGNQFAEKALNEGAAYAVVDDREVVKNENYIWVDDVLETLQKLALHHRKRLNIPIVGITGTNGKTTTKELITAVLSKKYRVLSTKGNLNNHIGVPLTLLQLKPDTEIGIIEMGANHPGEIHVLCKIADPDYGIITNVGKAHLEGFGSFDGVKKTKAELYRYLGKKEGKIFLNKDNSNLLAMAGENITTITYGTSGKVYLRGESVNQSPYLATRVWFPGGILYLNSKLIGNYNFENILAAACIGKYFEVDPLLIQKAISEYTPDNNRSQFIEKGTNKIIMDAYNANPTSMQASISNFITLPGKEKCLILGDMLELGDVAMEEHQKIVDLINPEVFSKAYLIGKNFMQAKIPGHCKVFQSTDLLCEHLKKNPLTSSVILIKGSRAIKLEKVLDVL